MVTTANTIATARATRSARNLNIAFSFAGAEKSGPRGSLVRAAPHDREDHRPDLNPAEICA